MQGWADRIEALRGVTQSQIFFIGGAPRSGTTWVQHLLDSHPDICCRGEALFMQTCAEPLDALVASRHRAIASKNQELFGALGGYMPPEQDDAEILLGTSVLLSLARQSAGGTYRAIGEKTPENVFLFPRLKRLFPAAKMISVARDPRDVMASTWHLFHRKHAGTDEAAAKRAMIERLLPPLSRGARAMLALEKMFPGDTKIVTYEALQRDPAGMALRLFAFLGVAGTARIVDTAVEASSFSTMSRGRKRGETQDGAFMRSGVAGGWAATITPEMNRLILREAGWMFSHFGWEEA